MDLGLRENSSFIWVCLETGNTHTTKNSFSTWRIRTINQPFFWAKKHQDPKKHQALGHLNFKEQDPTGRQEKWLLRKRKRWRDVCCAFWHIMVTSGEIMWNQGIKLWIWLPGVGESSWIPGCSAPPWSTTSADWLLCSLCCLCCLEELRLRSMSTKIKQVVFHQALSRASYFQRFDFASLRSSSYISYQSYLTTLDPSKTIGQFHKRAWHATRTSYFLTLATKEQTTSYFHCGNSFPCRSTTYHYIPLRATDTHRIP